MASDGQKEGPKWVTRLHLVVGVAAVAAGIAVAVGRPPRPSPPAPAVATAPSSIPSAFAPRKYEKPLLSGRVLEIAGEDDEGGDEDLSEDADEALSTFKPRDDRPAWKLKLPIDWAASPFKDRNWEFQLHSLVMTTPLLADYEATANPERYRQALAFVLDWWSFHENRKKPPKHAWYDMAVGKRATILAYLLDRAFAGKVKLSEADRGALFAMSAAHVKKLMNPKFIVMTNHGLFQIQGLSALCRVLGEVAECRGAEDYVEQRLSALLDAQFDERGVHREQSPQYHRLALDTMAQVAQPHGTGVYKKIADRLELARGVFPWLVFPGGRLAALGDTEGEAPSLAPPPDQKCRDAAADCVEVGDFSSSGYVVVRSPFARPLSESFMLILTGQYHRRAHKHVDDLSFELMEGGELLFEDAGKYAYLKDEMNRFVHSARAHSTVGLSSREILVKDLVPYGSVLEPPRTEAGVFTLRGKVARGELFTQARRIDYAPGQFLLIDDKLESNARQSYESYLHLAHQLTPTRKGRAFVVPLADGRTMRIESLSPDCQASEARGRKEPLQGWYTKAYRDMAPASALTFACAGKNRRITLLVSFGAEGRKAGMARAVVAARK